MIDPDRVAIVSNMNAESPALTLLIAEEPASWLPLSHRSATLLSRDGAAGAGSCAEMGSGTRRAVESFPRSGQLTAAPKSSSKGAPCHPLRHSHKLRFRACRWVSEWGLSNRFAEHILKTDPSEEAQSGCLCGFLPIVAFVVRLNQHEMRPARIRDRSLV